jgi:CheY-like chemotaxis protein
MEEEVIMNTALRVLLVDDSKGDANLIVLELQDSGYAPEFERVDKPETFRAALTGQSWDIIICDYFMPRFSGLDALAMVKENDLDLPFIIVSGVIGEDVAVAAIKSGAYDYVMKDNLVRLGPAVRRALQEAEDHRARKQAEEEVRRRNQELALLNRVGQALNSTLDLDQVLATILEEARCLLGVVASSIWLVDPESDEVVCRQATGPKSSIVRGWRLPPGEGIAGWVAHHNQSLIVPDVQSDERYFGEVGQQMGLDLRSLLSVPLKIRQDVIGVIQVVDTGLDRFGEKDRALLESLAAPAATAIENARLYEQAQQEIIERKQAEESLREALAQVKKLSGLLPICANCKKIRDDEGYWQDVAVYVQEHSEAEFTHGICSDCAKELYPDFLED